MQTIELNVCNMEIFGNHHENFWMGELTNLLERFPILEFPHKQNFYSILFFEEADGEIIIDNQKCRIDAGKVVIIHPRCISKIDINKNAKGNIICFREDFFSLRYNDNILSQFSFFKRESIGFIRISEHNFDKWNLILNLFYSEFVHMKDESKKILRSYLNIILFEIERLYTPLIYFKSKSIKKDKVTEFEKLIDIHFQTMKFPSDYARLLNVTSNYLNKLCKEETGETSGDLIRKRIMIEAKRLLIYSSNSINEIANELGFENSSYFITFFKKVTNFSPNQFRKLNNNVIYG